MSDIIIITEDSSSENNISVTQLSSPTEINISDSTAVNAVIEVRQTSPSCEINIYDNTGGVLGSGELFDPNYNYYITGSWIFNPNTTFNNNISVLGTVTTTNHGNSSQWKIAYDHSQITGNPHGTTLLDLGYTVASINYWTKTGNNLSYTTGTVSVINTILAGTYLTFNPLYNFTGSETTGSMFWDTTNHTVSSVLEGGVTLQHGQEMHIYGKNTSGATIQNGQPVSVITSPGQFTAFGPVDITTGYAYSYIGVATQTLAPNDFGYVTTSGMVRNINTTGLVEGAPIYVSPTGTLTATFPTPPNYIINVGIAERVHSTEGRIRILSLIVPKLADLSDVNGTPLSSTGQIPVWNNTTKVFDFTSNVNSFANISGTPVDNQLAVWNSPTTIEGNSNLTFNGTTLSTSGLFVSSGAGDNSFVGNLGIGTNDPSTKLHVEGGIRFKTTNSDYKKERIGSTTDYQKFVVILHEAYNGSIIADNYAKGTLYYDRGSTGAGLRYAVVDVITKTSYTSTIGSLVSTVPVSGGAALVTFTYNGIKYIGVEVNYAAQSFQNINWEGDHTSTSLSAPIVVAYYNVNTSSVLNDEINSSIATYISTEYKCFNNRYTILDGSLAVGISVPLSRLHVQAASGSTTLARFCNKDCASGVGSFLSIDSGASSGDTYIKLEAYDAGGSSSNNLILQQSAGGNVGVGNNNPSYKLDITGTFRATGTMTLNGLTYTFPTSHSTAGYVLTNNGSGTLSWTDKTTGGGAPGTGIVTLGGLNAVTQFFATETGLTISSATATHTLSISSTHSLPTTSEAANYLAAYNDKINSASFNVSDGILTLTQQDGGFVTADLDGRYSLSSHVLDSSTHTISGKTAGQVLLATGATAYAFTTISNDATISGTGVLTLRNVGTEGTYKSVTTDAQGRITSGTNPNTLSGFGIIDAYTKLEVNSKFVYKDYNISNGFNDNYLTFVYDSPSIGVYDLDYIAFNKSTDKYYFNGSANSFQNTTATAGIVATSFVKQGGTITQGLLADGSVTTISTFAKTFLDDSDATAVRSTLGLVIGTNVQAYSSYLQGIVNAGFAASAGFVKYDDSVWSLDGNSYSLSSHTHSPNEIYDSFGSLTASGGIFQWTSVNSNENVTMSMNATDRIINISTTGLMNGMSGMADLSFSASTTIEIRLNNATTNVRIDEGSIGKTFESGSTYFLTWVYQGSQLRCNIAKYVTQ